MSEKYIPRHKAPGKHRAVKPRRAARTTVMITGLAAAATTASVVTGVVSLPEPTSAGEALTLSAAGQGEQPAIDQLTSRSEPVTRSASRRRTDPAKAAALSAADGPASTESEDLSNADPREIAKALLPEYGFSTEQFGCLDSLYVSESNWRIDADNPSSSAYGIPQALTATHDMPAGYMTSAEVQIRWGLDYISRTYGTPCSAWSFKASHGWY